MVDSGRLVLVCGLPGSGKTTEAIRLAAANGGVRLCPDEWLAALGADLWDAAARDRVEALQWELGRRLLEVGNTVIVEWGLWSRSERDRLRLEARQLGVRVELRYLEAPVEVLWERVATRQVEGRWPARPIRRSEIDARFEMFDAPTPEEAALYDSAP